MNALFQLCYCVHRTSMCLQDHALLDGMFQCCHCVCRTSMCSCTMHCCMVCLVLSLFAGPVCVPVPCTVGWSVSMLSLCFRTSMCSCTMYCWMVCFNVVTVFQDQYVFLYHVLLDGLFQCCHCVSGPVCVPVPCSVGWSVSMLSLCFRTSMCSCTMIC